MSDDADVKTGRQTLRGWLSGQVRPVPAPAEPQESTPKVWENAGELLSQEFRRVEPLRL